jgi:hypothetical protein
MYKNLATHIVVYYNTIKFRGTLPQCIREKKRLAKIYGVFGLKILNINEF